METNVLLTNEDIKNLYSKFYENSFFVRLVEGSPDINWVKNTNFCDIAYHTQGNKVVVFSAILAVIGPLIEDTARKQAPAVMGGIALLTVGAGLFLTSLLMRGLVIGGFVNWIAATLLVWIGSVAASLILPKIVDRYRKV